MMTVMRRAFLQMLGLGPIAGRIAAEELVTSRKVASVVIGAGGGGIGGARNFIGKVTNPVIAEKWKAIGIMRDAAYKLALKHPDLQRRLRAYFETYYAHTNYYDDNLDPDLYALKTVSRAAKSYYQRQREIDKSIKTFMLRRKRIADMDKFMDDDAIFNELVIKLAKEQLGFDIPLAEEEAKKLSENQAPNTTEAANYPTDRP